MKQQIEVLVSTMNLDSNENLIRNMNISGKSITINQITNANKLAITDGKSKHKVFSFFEKGLSKSRNKAIEKSDADICAIADDDLVYLNDYEETIKSAYNKYSDADIIAFNVESTNIDRPTTKQKNGMKGYLNSMKIASFQITFKSQNIKGKIVFDELFGAGSGKYKMGEENIFLFDCLRRGLKVYYVSDTIATVTHKDSTWFNGYDETYFVSKGACFYRMTKAFWMVMILQFAVRKYKLYKKEMNFFKALKLMYKGGKIKSREEE